MRSYLGYKEVLQVGVFGVFSRQTKLRFNSQKDSAHCGYFDHLSLENERSLRDVVSVFLTRLRNLGHSEAETLCRSLCKLDCLGDLTGSAMDEERTEVPHLTLKTFFFLRKVKNQWFFGHDFTS